MSNRRKILESLTRARLLEIARRFGLSGLSGKPKAQIVARLSRSRTVELEALLGLLNRSELKAACRALGLDDTGREKALLVERLLGPEGRPAPRSRNRKRRKRASRTVSDKLQEPLMARSKRQHGDLQTPVGDYRHEDARRRNNPEAGPAHWETRKTPKTSYQYDPHLDPQLVWAGKAEHLSFQVDTVSLHLHQRVSAQAVIDTIRKNGRRRGEQLRLNLFADPQLPLDQAVEFYQHDVDWANRLILGDSLLVANSLLQRERMAGQVQMIYVDPPYGVAYNSNFQPSTFQRDVRDGRDDSLTREPEQIKAYRDTWRLGIHSYLTYLRDRLLLCRELLAETGSIFVQISDENLHHVRELMDEVFGAENFCCLITFRKTGGMSSSLLGTVGDFLLWYAKDRSRVKYRQLYSSKRDEIGNQYTDVELPDGTRRRMTRQEREDPTRLPPGTRAFQLTSLQSDGRSAEADYRFQFQGKVYEPNPKSHWKTSLEGLERLAKADRIALSGRTLRYVRYLDDFPVKEITNIWDDVMGPSEMLYVVQTNTKVVQRCLLMTTDPGDLVFDPTCGSGTTAYVAEQWGRRWITCDTSRVALALARQRLLTATFPYYKLAHPEQGVDAGFVYETVPHVTLRSIAQNDRIDDIHRRYQQQMEPLRNELNRLLERSWEPWQIPRRADRHWPREAQQAHRRWWGLRRQRQQEIDQAIARGADQAALYDQPVVERGKVRVSGPFTVESIPVATIEAPDDSPIRPWEAQPAGSNARQFQPPAGNAGGGDESTGFVLDMIEALRRSGIHRLGGGTIRFSTLHLVPSAGVIQAEGELLLEGPGAGCAQARPGRRFGISFGPRYGPVTMRQVEEAVDEARGRYDGVVIAGFHFDAPAQEFLRRKLPVEVMGAYINPDVLVGDLLKTSRASQVFTLFGRADIEVLGGKYLVAGDSGRRIANYQRFQELSGIRRLEDIRRLEWYDLFFYALVSQGEEMHHYLTERLGWDFRDGRSCRGVEGNPRGELPAAEWNSPRLIGQNSLRGQSGSSGLRQYRQALQRLRKDRQVLQQLEQLAQTLDFPLDRTQVPRLGVEDFCQVQVRGVDLYDPQTGEVHSDHGEHIAAWFLDADYDNRCFNICQAFFPGRGNPWRKLVRTLRGVVQEQALEGLQGLCSFPFRPGKRIAVKVIDHRGNEMLEVFAAASGDVQG